ncbi:NAD(P)-binding domain-containing protein [Burkholderia sp. Ac-20353]|uniref:NAD(P)-binding domain-containing protein n=1 Tax=Burkholderia sp. Ac-20353 TaxID=2703894 RepID=UPI00197BA2D4|nr:NAD(P)-binding domain-containing protein [Burkholderia sp. Ac-20353]MBN3785766.1 NAD(P)-binding domain-containing protein [Burkholderia sp. Ac-20353]
MESIETVVIGAGQAGLALSWHLSQRRCEHLVLERARIAERWHSQRWDSLYFQFPNWSIELPGQPPYTGGPPDAFAHRSEVWRFLEHYAAAIRAPVRCNTEVTTLRREGDRSTRFRLVTPQRELRARNVVVATGPYQYGCVPLLQRGLPPEVMQIHAGDYRNPDRLPEGAVLVIGSGASGCQIADELLDAGRRTYLSVGRHQRSPRRYRGRDAFWWRRELGLLDETAAELPPECRMPAALLTGVHGGYDVDLRQSAARGLSLLGHLQKTCDGRLHFADDLETHLRGGDRSLEAFVARIDAHVARTDGLDVEPAPDKPRVPARTVFHSPPQLDARADRIGSVIWATGYRFDFGWIKVPEVFDAAGAPVHRRGITEVPGLYFLGLPWLYKRKSTFLMGVGEDAAHIAATIADESRQRRPGDTSSPGAADGRNDQ